MASADVRASPPKSLTPEWYQARRGRITASRRAQIIVGRPTSWRDLGLEIDDDLADDWEHKDSDAAPLRWGREHEREALDAVQAEFGAALTEPGLVLHPAYGCAGATPDGFIGADTTIQTKCPYLSRNHLRTVVDGKLSWEYYVQVQFESWVSGRPRIVFASWDPRQPRSRRLCMIVVPMDTEMHLLFADRMNQFREAWETNTWPGKLRVDSGIPTDLF